MLNTHDPVVLVAPTLVPSPAPTMTAESAFAGLRELFELEREVFTRNAAAKGRRASHGGGDVAAKRAADRRRRIAKKAAGRLKRMRA